MSIIDPKFPCSIVIDIPLPTPRLADAALRALQVDAELSPLVQRSMSLIHRHDDDEVDDPAAPAAPAPAPAATAAAGAPGGDNILRTEYKATTNRMLRVAVNGFMESVGVVLGVMEELDVDVC